MTAETKQVRLLPRGGADGFRWTYQTERDDRLYRAGHFADFRQRWQADLEDWHWQFRSKLEAL